MNCLNSIKKFVTPNINIYLSQLGKPGSEIKKVPHYYDKSYIPETFQINLLKKNYDNLLTRYFGVEKIFNLFLQKCYLFKIRVDVKKYIQDCNICKKNKKERYKLYDNMQSIPVFIYKWKEFNIDFVIRLLNSKDW